MNRIPFVLVNFPYHTGLFKCKSRTFLRSFLYTFHDVIQLIWTVSSISLYLS